VGRFINNIAIDILDPCLQRTPTVEWALEMLSELAFQCMGPVKQDMAAMSDVQRGHARRQPTLRHRHHQPRSQQDLIEIIKAANPAPFVWHYFILL
jgi:hypothetical protein